MSLVQNRKRKELFQLKNFNSSYALLPEADFAFPILTRLASKGALFAKLVEVFLVRSDAFGGLRNNDEFSFPLPAESFKSISNLHFVSLTNLLRSQHHQF